MTAFGSTSRKIEWALDLNPITRRNESSSTKMRFWAALLFIVIASLATMPHVNAATLWYNGDKSQAGLDNEVVTIVGGEAYSYVYDDFTVTGSPWHVTSVWSNNLLSFTGVTQADWFIRSGVSNGS
jgi:hypothetical protein